MFGLLRLREPPARRIEYEIGGDEYKMIGLIASADGEVLCRGEITGSLSDAVALGRRLAEQLLNDGADRLLKLTY